MKFSDILDGVEKLSQSGDPEVNGLEYDSRCVKAGNLFVAMKGESNDGNRFIDQAILAGAIAIVTDSPAEKRRDGMAWAQVAHGRRALARLSANFYHHPIQKIAVTGVTGTNGKSTTAFLVEAILKAAKRQSMLIGTIEYHVAGRILPALHTTPEALELNRLFAEASQDGVTDAIMEVSSHALEQERVYGMPFDVAAFTNLTRDHLDYHETMEQYFAAKRILFQGSGADGPRMSVLNTDDEYGEKLIPVSKGSASQLLTYGWSKGDFHVVKAEITPRGTRLDMATPAGSLEAFSQLIGRVNVYNILCAAAIGHARGCSREEISQGISALTHVPGRFERVDCGQPFTVVVDYAHTDDALRNLTILAREFVQQAGQKGRVITLFGCGGDRDRNKRPLMGEAAGRGSDLVVLTTDNPRSEDPIAIINDALVGLQKSGVKYKIEPDRRAAIALAIREAAAGDIVLLAGKGHEKVQIMRAGSQPFDDVEVAREALKAAGFDCAANTVTVKNS